MEPCEKCVFLGDESEIECGERKCTFNDRQDKKDGYFIEVRD